ncbi:MAG: hypothetical protein K2X27_20495 [Candidatus Obscuribacterales bacterium]|nr:hypothetical protein [Candidatus Obscuribacterales bacterium]
MDELESLRNLKLGELLVAAGLLTRSEIEGHLALAKFMGLPLGNLLVREKKLSREVLKVAIRLQTLISDGMISLQLACRAMRDIVSGVSQAEEILESLDSYSENVRSCRLGELLIDAGLLSEVALGIALVSSVESRKPLGQTLIQQGTLSPEVVGAALFAQGNVRARVIDYKAAVAQLKDVQFSPLAQIMQAC